MILGTTHDNALLPHMQVPDNATQVVLNRNSYFIINPYFLIYWPANNPPDLGQSDELKPVGSKGLHYAKQIRSAIQCYLTLMMMRLERMTGSCGM